MGSSGLDKGADKMTIYRARHEPDWPLLDKGNREEVEALWRNQTWELFELPPGQSVTGTQMLCDRKRGPTGEIERYKGRLLASGDKQVHGFDYLEVWALVARDATPPVFLVQCASTGLRLAQMDVDTVFLNGPVSE